MKNVSYSTILFSAFSPTVLLTPVKNSINPINSSVKKIIKDKKQNNKKLFMSSSNINISNINKYNIAQKKFFYNKRSDSAADINTSYKPKILHSFYNVKPLKKEIKLNNKRKFTKDFIIFRPQRIKSCNTSLKKIYKSQRCYVEPYKKYLFEKNKIEKNKRAKEIEMNYIIESKKQQQLKLENDIRNKYQGLDFSRQKKREFFLEKYLKSKEYTKKEEKKKNDDDNLYRQLDTKYLLKKLNFEMNEKKYLFHENNEIMPRVRYSSFSIKLKDFLWNLKENPNYNILINYISKNK